MGPGYNLPSQTENVPERPPGSLFGDNSLRVGVRADGKTPAMKRTNPYSGLVDGLSAGELDLLSARRCREKAQGGGRPSGRSPRPPSCTARTPRARPAGRRRPGGTGSSRRACAGGAARGAARGSPRFPARSSRTARSRFRPGSTSSASRSSPCRSTPARRCAASPTRPPGSGATGSSPAVDGYQDRIVLRGRAWIDETYVNDTDLSKGYGQARKRGLSKQKICIAGRDRLPQGARRGGMRARQALVRPDQEGDGGARREGRHPRPRP